VPEDVVDLPADVGDAFDEGEEGEDGRWVQAGLHSAADAGPEGLEALLELEGDIVVRVCVGDEVGEEGDERRNVRDLDGQLRGGDGRVVHRSVSIEACQSGGALASGAPWPYCGRSFCDEREGSARAGKLFEVSVFTRAAGHACAHALAAGMQKV
jgi:hypothetical protein